MPLPKSQLDRIIDAVTKVLDELEPKMRSDFCNGEDERKLAEQLGAVRPGGETLQDQRSEKSPPERIHGRDLF
jgi:hypothetical protein